MADVQTPPVNAYDSECMQQQQQQKKSARANTKAALIHSHSNL